MKKCPYCAEMIKDDAIKCRYCGSNTDNFKQAQVISDTSEHWHRVDTGKRVAGVCTGIAHEFNSPHIILPLRLFFVVSTLFYGFGLILYIALWILMPNTSDNREKRNAANQAVSYTGKNKPSETKKPVITNAAVGILLIIAGIFAIKLVLIIFMLPFFLLLFPVFLFPGLLLSGLVLIIIGGKKLIF